MGEQFSKDQKLFLRESLQRGIESTPYADPEYAPVQMLYMLNALELGIDVKDWKPNKPTEQMDQIISERTKEILTEAGINPDDFDPQQQEQLSYGLVQNLDVSSYADPDIEWQVMGMIRVELSKSVK